MSYIKNYTNTYVIRGHKYKVTAPARFSDNGELLSDRKLDNNAVLMARQMYRDDQGIVSPNEIKLFRKKVGITQRELAELTGFSPNTVALYETGAFPTDANNKILKLLINSDEALKDYIQDNSYSEQLRGKIDNYLNGKNIRDDKELEKVPSVSALELANWFRVTNSFEHELDGNVEPLTQMKVIKLLYFAFGEYLARTGTKLFHEDFYKWDYGPVVKEVHDKYKGKTIIVDQWTSMEDEATRDFNEIASIKPLNDFLSTINSEYGKYTAYALSKRTHQKGSPWNETQQNEKISLEKIYYSFKNGNRN